MYLAWILVMFLCNLASPDANRVEAAQQPPVGYEEADYPDDEGYENEEEGYDEGEYEEGNEEDNEDDNEDENEEDNEDEGANEDVNEDADEDADEDEDANENADEDENEEEEFEEPKYEEPEYKSVAPDGEDNEADIEDPDEEDTDEDEEDEDDDEDDEESMERMKHLTDEVLQAAEEYKQGMVSEGLAQDKPVLKRPQGQTKRSSLDLKKLEVEQAISSIEKMRAGLPVPPAMKAKIPPALKAKIPPAVKAKIPPPMKAKIPPPMKAKIPPPVKAKIPPPVKAKIPPPVKANLPSVKAKIPPPVKANLPSLKANLPQLAADRPPPKKEILHPQLSANSKLLHQLNKKLSNLVDENKILKSKLTGMDQSFGNLKLKTAEFQEQGDEDLIALKSELVTLVDNVEKESNLYSEKIKVQLMDYMETTREEHNARMVNIEEEIQRQIQEIQANLRASLQSEIRTSIQDGLKVIDRKLQPYMTIDYATRDDLSAKVGDIQQRMDDKMAALVAKTQAKMSRIAEAGDAKIAQTVTENEAKLAMVVADMGAKLETTKTQAFTKSDAVKLETLTQINGKLAEAEASNAIARDAALAKTVAEIESKISTTASDMGTKLESVKAQSVKRSEAVKRDVVAIINSKVAEAEANNLAQSEEIKAQIDYLKTDVWAQFSTSASDLDRYKENVVSNFVERDSEVEHMRAHIRESVSQLKADIAAQIQGLRIPDLVELDRIVNSLMRKGSPSQTEYLALVTKLEELRDNLNERVEVLEEISKAGVILGESALASDLWAEGVTLNPLNSNIWTPLKIAKLYAQRFFNAESPEAQAAQPESQVPAVAGDKGKNQKTRRRERKQMNNPNRGRENLRTDKRGKLQKMDKEMVKRNPHHKRQMN